MAEPQLTGVVLRYVHAGQGFTVELDPAEVKLIFMGPESEFHKQAGCIGKQRPDRKPDPARLKPNELGVLTATSAGLVSDTVKATGVWWWIGGGWVHPQDPPGGA